MPRSIGRRSSLENAGFCSAHINTELVFKHNMNHICLLPYTSKKVWLNKYLLVYTIGFIVQFSCPSCPHKTRWYFLSLVTFVLIFSSIINSSDQHSYALSCINRLKQVSLGLSEATLTSFKGVHLAWDTALFNTTYEIKIQKSKVFFRFIKHQSSGAFSQVRV